MGTREEIKRFLLADLPDRVRAFHPVAEGDAYFDRESRFDRAASEIFLYWRGRDVVSLGLGTGRPIQHSVFIEFFKARANPFEDPRFNADLEEAARELVEGYDDNIDLFRNALSRSVDSVKCYEVSDIEATEDSGNRRFILQQAFMLEIITWEDQ